MELPNEDSALPERGDVSDARQAELVGQILRGELTPQQACENEGLSERELKRWVRAYTRAARQAIDAEVAAALAAHGLEIDDRPTPEFSGNLGSVGLPELIQTIQYGKKDASIRIDHDGQQSFLWCMEGDVVDAASAQLTGSGAVYRILSIQRGQLHADFSPVQRSRTVHASTQALMLEAAKRADECAEIRRRLGDTLNIYVPSSSAPSELLIEHDQAAVLRAFDGRRSIEDVVHQSELPDLETLSVIERLLEQEWLVLAPFRSKTSNQRLSRTPPPSSVDASFRPLAASFASRWSVQESARRLWASALAGAAVVAGAFAIGFYSAQRDGTPAASGELAAASACGVGLVPLPGGVCIDRAEVSAGDYQACVHAGACEPVQRELQRLAPGGRGVSSPDGDSAAVDAVAPPVAATGGQAADSVAPVVPAHGGAATGSTVPASVTAALPAPAASATAPPPIENPAGAGGSMGSAASAGAALAAPAGSSSALTPAAPAPAPSRSLPAEAVLDGSGARCNAGLTGRERHAANCVTFRQARRYCEWRGGRLPLRGEWELAASPEQAHRGVVDLAGGLSEWATEPATGTTEASRERAVVLGGGLAAGSGAAGAVTRLYMNANAQGRSVGFRCVLPASAASARAANGESTPR